RITLVKGADAIRFAAVMVHESWHTTGARHGASDPGDETNNECNESTPNPLDPSDPFPSDVCNEFIVQAPGSHSGELVERQSGYPIASERTYFFDSSVGPGSYQMGEEFTCDLALHAADWVPLMVSLEADFDHDAFFERDYYTNINRSRNTGPVPCDDVIHGAFRAAAGGGTCAVDENVCFADSDCDQSGGYQLCSPPGSSPCLVQSCLASADCPAAFPTCDHNCCIVIK